MMRVLVPLIALILGSAIARAVEPTTTAERQYETLFVEVKRTDVVQEGAKSAKRRAVCGLPLQAVADPELAEFR